MCCERALADDPRLEVDVRRESDYYAEQSRPLTTLITTAGVFIARPDGVPAPSSPRSAPCTPSVVSRTREIATLACASDSGDARSSAPCWLKPRRWHPQAARSVRSTAWLLFDGYAVSTLNFQSMSQVAFAFAVTPPLVTQAMTYAVGMGLVGAMWPAWRAARLPVAAGLRE